MERIERSPYIRHMLDEADAWPRLHQALDGLNPDDVADLERGAKIARELVYGAQLPRDLQQAIRAGYRKLVEQYGKGPSLAVRSSATAEELEVERRLGRPPRAAADRAAA